MGIDSADYDHDGWPDIVKTNFSDDTNNLYHNDHNGEFTDLAGSTGFGPVSIPFLGFGVKFFDFDNDGWKDIFVANGHVNPQVDQHSFGVTYAERPLLFHNLQEWKVRRDRAQHRTAAVPPLRGSRCRDRRLSQQRQRRSADDRPGRLSGAVCATSQPSSGHWLRIKTVGKKSNRDGFGARVEVKAGSLTQSAEVRANSSFESASDPRLHFGLGSATRVDSIVVRWPSGKVDNIGSQAVDQELSDRRKASGVDSPSEPTERPAKSSRTSCRSHTISSSIDSPSNNIQPSYIILTIFQIL